MKIFYLFEFHFILLIEFHYFYFFLFVLLFYFFMLAFQILDYLLRGYCILAFVCRFGGWFGVYWLVCFAAWEAELLILLLEMDQWLQWASLSGFVFDIYWLVKLWWLWTAHISAPWWNWCSFYYSWFLAPHYYPTARRHCCTLHASRGIFIFLEFLMSHFRHSRRNPRWWNPRSLLRKLRQRWNVVRPRILMVDPIETDPVEHLATFEVQRRPQWLWLRILLICAFIFIQSTWWLLIQFIFNNASLKFKLEIKCASTIKVEVWW